MVSGSLWKIDSIFQLSMELFDTDEEKLLAWTMGKELEGFIWHQKRFIGKIINGLNIKIINELDIDGSINPEAYELYLKKQNIHSGIAKLLRIKE